MGKNEPIVLLVVFGFFHLMGSWTSLGSLLPNRILDLVDQHYPRALFNGSNEWVTTNTTTKVPKRIYIFWESGWDSAIPAAQLALRTWTALNPDFDIVALDGPTAQNLTQPQRFVPAFVWNQTTVQARSDVFRTILLHQFGGIWVDASLFCNLALSQWLDLSQDDLFAPLRRVGLARQKQLQLFPWVASWFLVAPPHSYMLTRVLEQLRKDPKVVLSEYNWWHRLVANLALEEDQVLKRIFRNFPFDRPMQSCNQPQFALQAPMFKRCAVNLTATSYLVSQVCCSSSPGPQNELVVFHNHPEDHQFVQEKVCPRWNCTSYGHNFYSVLPLLQQHYQARNQTMPSIDSPLFWAGLNNRTDGGGSSQQGLSVHAVKS